MADVKISGLPASTTPLAGTEVLPIVQSGVTKKVASDDLTVKNIRSNATSGVLQIAGPAAAATRVMTTPDANFTAARIDAAQSFTGDQTLSTGNLVIGTSGKGIDFSATAGTGTSELLDDYETGTFSPTVVGTTTAGTATYGVNGRLGTYTKIGNSVTVQIILSWTAHTGTGNINITGLPFTCKALYSASTTPLSYNLTLPAGAYLLAAVTQNSAIIELFQKDVNAAGGVWGGVAMDTNVDALIINVTYTV